MTTVEAIWIGMTIGLLCSMVIITVMMILFRPKRLKDDSLDLVDKAHQERLQKRYDDAAKAEAEAKANFERVVGQVARLSACGIAACRIREPHSHVQDLARRLKEK
jgi:hypothetical protein